MNSDNQLLSRIIQTADQVAHHLHSMLVKVFPPASGIVRAGNIYAETLGLAGLLLFLVNINLVKDLYGAGEIMLVAAFGLAWRNLKPLLSEPLFWLGMVWIAAVLASTFSGIRSFPSVPAAEHFDEARRMIKYTLFVVVGWWISANSTSVRNSLIIVCAGFIISSLHWISDLDTLSVLFEGERARSDILGMRIHHYAQWAGFLLLGVFFLGKDLFPAWFSKSKAFMCLRHLLILAAFVILIIGVVVTQSRTIWAALIISVAVGMVMNFLLTKRNILQKIIVSSIILALLAGLYSFGHFGFIKDRIDVEKDTAVRILQGDIDHLERDAISLRLNLYIWAYNFEGLVSFFGWGPLGIKQIRHDDESRAAFDWPDDLEKSHLHNDFLEILFRTGLFGLTTLILILFFTLKSITRGVKTGAIPTQYYLFFMVSILFILLSGMTSFVLRTVALIPVLWGLMFASILHARQQLAEGDNARDSN